MKRSSRTRATDGQCLDDTDVECDAPNNEYHLKYGVEDHAPLHISIMYGIQLLLGNVRGPVTTVFVIHGLICTSSKDNLLLAELISTSIFMAGVATLLQVMLGLRLPAIQCSSSTFLAPITIMMSTAHYKCPPPCDVSDVNGTLTALNDSHSTTSPCEDEPWRSRLLEINGCLICASFVEVLMGLTGAIGFVQSYVGPVTVGTAITLVGLTLFQATTSGAQHHWGVAIFTCALYIMFAVFLAGYSVPVPGWTRERGCIMVRYPIFKVFPHILAICGGWLLCLVLTESGSLTDDPNDFQYPTRTDAKLDVIWKSKWFFWPYPGYWGRPTFGIGVFVGFIAVVLSSISESVGDYYAMAAVCGVPTPPKHAVNRGIMIEGICSMVSGLLGACHATTTYSDAVGTVAVTGVASRSTYALAAVMFIVFGLFGKFGAALSIIPEPVIGGMAIVSFGIITAVGISCFRHCNMTSVRNLVIVGVALIIGMKLPFYMADNPDWIDTGNSDWDQVITLFLGTGLFVGTLVALILDNIAPGTKEERGIIQYEADLKRSSNTTDSSMLCRSYDLPYVTAWMKRQTVLTYVPFLPSYIDRDWPCRPPACPCYEDEDEANAYPVQDDVVTSNHHVTYAINMVNKGFVASNDDLVNV